MPDADPPGKPRGGDSLGEEGGRVTWPVSTRVSTVADLVPIGDTCTPHSRWVPRRHVLTLFRHQARVPLVGPPTSFVNRGGRGTQLLARVVDVDDEASARPQQLSEPILAALKQPLERPQEVVDGLKPAAGCRRVCTNGDGRRSQTPIPREQTFQGPGSALCRGNVGGIGYPRSCTLGDAVVSGSDTDSGATRATHPFCQRASGRPVRRCSMITTAAIAGEAVARGLPSAPGTRWVLTALPCSPP